MFVGEVSGRATVRIPLSSVMEMCLLRNSGPSTSEDTQ